MGYNNADGAYHQAITHLGKTHFLMDGVYAAVSRHLSPSHPIYKLLKPHFHYTLAINNLADDLIDGGVTDGFMSYGISGLLETIHRAFTDLGLNTIGDFGDDLYRRGLLDLDV